jgi:acyl dehydratase
MRLLVENYLPPGGSLGGPGVEEIRWPNPVRPGDTVRVRATVIEARKSQSRPDRGIVKTTAEAVNQDGQTVMRTTAVNFIATRPAGAP